jgi:iron complex transport system substrate-binding protein
MFPPSRIVCLTEETVETFYFFGEQDRIVDISGYVVRPPHARREKPRVSAFTSATVDKILAEARPRPDVLQSSSRHRRGSHPPRARRPRFNQQSVAGILNMIRMIGAIVGAKERAEGLVATLERRLVEVRERAKCPPRRPRVFFEGVGPSGWGPTRPKLRRA